MSQESDASRHEKGVPIFVNNREVHMPSDDATGAEIKRHADVPPDFKLYGPEGEPIGDAKQVELHRRERFTAISGQDVS
jgi:hypothetical protein